MFNEIFDGEGIQFGDTSEEFLKNMRQIGSDGPVGLQTATRIMPRVGETLWAYRQRAGELTIVGTPELVVMVGPGGNGHWKWDGTKWGESPAQTASWAPQALPMPAPALQTVTSGGGNFLRAALPWLVGFAALKILLK